MGKRIGVYGGSFDPVHLGHLNLAIEMKERHKLNQVCFYPTFLNPQKFTCPSYDETIELKKNERRGAGASPEERLQMIKLALEGIPGLSWSALEYERAAPSYTIDTLRCLVADRKEGEEFYLILGEDAARHLHQWRQPDELIKLAHLLIGTRGIFLNEKTSPFQGSPGLTTAIREGLTLMPLMDISSTEIRNRLAQGLYCGHLLPAKVMDYIRSNQLYCSQKLS